MRSLQPDVPEGPRSDILACVRQVPGIHLRGIERATDLPLGQVVYHLDRLQRMGLIASQRDRGFRRFYTTRDVDRGEKRWIAALRHKTPRQIVLELLRRPGQTHKSLRDAVGVAGSTLTFHLQRLVEADVLRRERAGAAVVYEVANREAVLEVLAQRHDTFADPDVARFVREAGLRIGHPGSVRVPVATDQLSAKQPS